jgi:hypothetical protein
MKPSGAILILIIASLILLAGCTKPEAGPALLVEEAWARPGTAGDNSVVYFTIDNSGGSADQLLGASGEAAESLELHRSQMDEDGVMSMEPQPMVDIPAGGEVVFKPGDYHIMLINLKQALKLDDSFQITLNFKNAGDVTVTVKVSE